MLILSIDTSTAACSVALHTDDTLLGCYELFTERTSAAMLTTLIRDVVEHTGHELNQLDAIAVAKGPGSYTGLRIGVSTAKGLCFALDKPLLAVNTLAAMTEQVRYHASLRPAARITPPGGPDHSARRPGSLLFCPMIDARRMEVYCALFDTLGHELQPTSAQIIDETSFSEWLANGLVVFFGDGAAKCRAMLNDYENAIFLDQLIVPSARTVGNLATLAFREGRFEDIATFEPFYLKDFMTNQPRKVVL